MKKTIVKLLGTTSIVAYAMATNGVATAADMPLNPIKVEERILSGSMGLYGAHTFGICHEDNCHGDSTENDSWLSLGGFGNVSGPFDDGLGAAAWVFMARRHNLFVRSSSYLEYSRLRLRG